MPTEATHDDIMRRVSAVECTQTVMQGQISRIGHQAERAAQAATDNRAAMDARIDEIKAMLGQHRDEFSSFRGEVRGAATVVKWGLPLGMTALLAVVGWALV